MGDELCSPFGFAKGDGMRGREAVEVIPAQNGKNVTKIVTASGVVGFIASDVPVAAIEGLYQKLLVQREKLNQAMQSPSTANPTCFRDA